MIGKDYAPCRHVKKDCAARTENGGCRALTDTNFGKKSCPFYKKKKKEKKKC